jgi:hypothetical protein
MALGDANGFLVAWRISECKGAPGSRRDWLTLAVPQRSKTVSIEKKNTAVPVTARSSLTALAGYERRLAEMLADYRLA